MLDVITGELKTGLEGVCCDRAFSMTAIEVERDGSSFVAAYESTFYGFVPEKWIDRLKIDTNRQSPDNRFILVSDKEDWSDAGNVWEGNCSYE